MKLVKQLLGKVSITVDKDDWNIDKAYDRLTLITSDNVVYISRLAVPKGIDITNRQYWKVLGPIADVAGIISQANAYTNTQIQQVIDELVKVCCIYEISYGYWADGVIHDTTVTRPLSGTYKIVIPDGTTSAKLAFAIICNEEDALSIKYADNKPIFKLINNNGISNISFNVSWDGDSQYEYISVNNFPPGTHIIEI